MRFIRHVGLRTARPKSRKKCSYSYIPEEKQVYIVLSSSRPPLLMKGFSVLPMRFGVDTGHERKSCVRVRFYGRLWLVRKREIDRQTGTREDSNRRNDFQGISRKDLNRLHPGLILTFRNSHYHFCVNLTGSDLGWDGEGLTQ